MVKSKKNIFVLTLISLFMIMFLGVPLVHNHDHTIQGGSDCPAFLLQLTLLSFTISLFLVIHGLNNISGQLFTADSQNFNSQSFYKLYSNKAPPQL